MLYFFLFILPACFCPFWSRRAGGHSHVCTFSLWWPRWYRDLFILGSDFSIVPNRRDVHHENEMGKTSMCPGTNLSNRKDTCIYKIEIYTPVTLNAFMIGFYQVVLDLISSVRQTICPRCLFFGECHQILPQVIWTKVLYFWVRFFSHTSYRRTFYLRCLSVPWCFFYRWNHLDIFTIFHLFYCVFHVPPGNLINIVCCNTTIKSLFSQLHNICVISSVEMLHCISRNSIYNTII